MAKFELALQKTLGNEGVYSNNLSDLGGETYAGISRKNWPDWLGWIAIDHLKLKDNFPENINDPGNAETKTQLQYEVKMFYYQNFWEPIKGDKIISQKVAESICDFGINAGIKASVKLAQQVVGVEDDGIIGNGTLTALNTFDERLFIAEFKLAKIDRYCDIVDAKPDQLKFLKGWVRRALK